ncbi:MAG TPA: cytochrome c-type biogenesis protein CcmH [Emcibacteraceae bacterium]|nr:cytochrome c-type biogenesis protein CcmH [Emcibacteraceae bacterium]HRW30306.1 cytochrome c-type biogenesis protein CcmH [Emcibacteraceae bacterium]
MISLLIFIGLSFSAYAIGVDEMPLKDPAQEARAQGIMKQLRCLVCQNESIVDSGADLAKDLRIIVRERITQGDTDEQVLAFMTSRYGDWVLLKPPFEGATIILWFSPILLLLIGFYIIYRNYSKRKPLGEVAPLTPEEERRLNSLLNEGAEK